MQTPSNAQPERKPLILVTNDDGIDTPGIQELAQLMTQRGEVVVVAPLTHQSGMGMAVSGGKELTVAPYTLGCSTPQYSVSGTPVDCVKVALQAVLTRHPDLVVSGINFGSNASVNANYSGTVGAAMEAAIFGIPSIAFSMSRRNLDGGYEPYHPYCLHLVDWVLTHGLPWGVTLNVNFPKKPVAGMRWARQARGRWVCENVIPQDPRDRAHYTPPSHYTINGEFEELEQEFPNTDLALLRERLVTVVPMYADPTHVGLLNQMKDTIWRPEE